MFKKFVPFQKKSANTADQQTEIHLNLHILPLLVLILGVLYLWTGFKGWLVFFIGASGAWLLAGLWVYSLRQNLWVERKIHLAWATVGESVPEHVRLINKGWFPAIWVEITDESQNLESPLRMVSDVGRHSTRNRNLIHLFKRRGLYSMGPTHLRSGDPFGIYTISIYEQHTSTILVAPPVLSLSHLTIPTGGWTGDERYQRGYIAHNVNDVGLRNYMAGDSLRRIHWHASAHFDTLIVRRQEAATSRDWCIIVDLDRNAQAGTGEHSTLELSIVLAASLAMRGLKESRRVGLLLAGPKYISLEPATDPAQSWRILRALAMAEAGHYSLGDLLHQARAPQAASVLLITSSVNPTWVAAASRHMQGNQVALLVDPTDFGSPVDQSQVISALISSRIPYIRMPASLLEKAYSTSEQDQSKRLNSGESLKRYLHQGRQAWKSIK